MTAGILQLVAHGIEDYYLSDNPQITFFKIVYRRHTNFSVESVIQNFYSAADFGETVSCTISRIGDLVGKIFLFVEIPAISKFIDSTTGEDIFNKKFAWVKKLGYAIIQEISIDIGGKLIDKQYGEWMYIWSEVSNRQDHALNKMIGDVPLLYQFTNGKPGYKLCIPLEFWFCRNNGLALPLLSLTSTDVKITVVFRKLSECYRIGPTNSIEILDDIISIKSGDYIEQTINGQTIYGYVIDYDILHKKISYIKIQNPTSPKKKFETYQDKLSDFMWIENKEKIDDFNLLPYRIYNSLTKTYCTPKPNTEEINENIHIPIKPRLVNSYFYVNYIYLDNEERNRFISSNNEYLIEQIQLNTEYNIKSPNIKFNLALNHPCKSHYWVVQLDRTLCMNDVFNYTTSHIPTKGKNPLINAKMILNGIDRFSKRSADYFNLMEPYEHHYRGPKLGIYVYSFSIYPENIQPSSTINMSKIDSIIMRMKLNNKINLFNTAKIKSYTINYNILRIIFNTGAVVFS